MSDLLYKKLKLIAIAYNYVLVYCLINFFYPDKKDPASTLEYYIQGLGPVVYVRLCGCTLLSTSLAGFFNSFKILEDLVKDEVVVSVKILKERS